MAVLRVVARLRNYVECFEEICSTALGLRFPSRPNFNAICITEPFIKSLEPLTPDTNDGFLWAVPKHRRTIEKRWMRKYGSPDYHLKLMLPKRKILVCNACGHYHEADTLCGYCYEQVAKETKLAQDAVQEQLGLSAIDKEVILLYENEPTPPDENKKVVEIRRERPQWFSRNLLQRTTDIPTPSAVATETEAVPTPVKPSELG